jgi:hypothetical protein
MLLPLCYSLIARVIAFLCENSTTAVMAQFLEPYVKISKRFMNDSLGIL